MSAVNYFEEGSHTWGPRCKAGSRGGGLNTLTLMARCW